MREKAMTRVSAATGIVAKDVCKSFGDHLVLDRVRATPLSSRRSLVGVGKRCPRLWRLDLDDLIAHR
jgi:hypothetical protein